MKNNIFKKIRFTSYLMLASIALISCERDISDDAVPATFPTTAEVYTDNPVGLTDQFFDSFDPAAGANPEAFGTDDEVSYLGTSSIRLDIPAPNDPDGGFVGGIFKDRGEGRNLTSYNALTLWVKASRTAVFDEMGFGFDFELDKFPVVRAGIPLSTDWRKVIIPIPDASRLIQEKGMFFFSTGTQSTDGVGFTVWIDEIRFEKLETLAQPQPRIFNGANVSEQGFVNVPVQITGLTQTFNSENGSNITVRSAPSYFDFESSNGEVATVNEFGVVSVVGVGEVNVSAAINGIAAQGSLTLNVEGSFNTAPVPPQRDANDVVSLFSDAYSNVPVRHYNGFFQFATTQGGEGVDPNNVDIRIPLGDGSFDNIINYTDLNFVSIGTYETVPFADASQMTHLHVDINVRDESIQQSDFIRLQIESNTLAGNPSSGSFNLNSSNFTPNEWLSLNIPLSSFSGNIDFANVGQLFFISDATISNIFVDNVYFFRE